MPAKEKETRPGIKQEAWEWIESFPEEEREIIKRLSKEWYITYGGRVAIGQRSTYRFILIKPVRYFEEMFNIDREIVLIFSPYQKFEPRTLTAITEATKKFPELRIERICSIVVSKDNEVEEKLKRLLENDHEAQIVVPFTYRELREKSKDNFFFRNRFKKHFYTRDLFASEAPLKKDLYFFGRKDLIHDLVDRHRSNQVSGLFGLRKTGKTSVIFGVQRALERIGAKSAFIDCQNPGFHHLKWNGALYYVLSEVKKQNHIDSRIGTQESYTETNAPRLFEKHIIRMYRALEKKNILLIFDEVENITPKISPSKHWREGEDFVFFWQTLRSLFQKLDNVFSYLIVGTNPLCVEMAKVGVYENPIYAQIPLTYIPRFDVPQTREMVRKLGRIMGLHFEEILYGKLTDDFGGHPYLIRHVCSVINKLCRGDRPVTVSKSLYEKAKKIFLRDYASYLDMILSVLREFFNDEYEMLCYLARGDVETFTEFATLNPLYTAHLRGYGILEESNGSYSFRIESIHEYLKTREKYRRLKMSTAEMIKEISERRNRLEQRLRSLCRMQLKSHLGEVTATDAIIKIMGNNRRKKLIPLSYPELFDPNKSGILFSDLIRFIQKHWDCFSNILGPNKDQLIADLKLINTLRADAHAKEITDDEFQSFRLSIGRVEKLLEDFFGR